MYMHLMSSLCIWCIECLPQWFNLDSLLEEPELVSDTYLNLLLEQLRQEGWSHDCHMTNYLSLALYIKPSTSVNVWPQSECVV